MSNWSVLKAAVSDAIKANGNQEITGTVLQEMLLNIVSSVGRHAAFAGMATPTTRPGTYDGPTFYIAITPGTYPNFGSARVAEGRIGIFYTTVDNSSWQLGSILVTAPLSDGSITTDKLEDGAVTRDKLALNSVDTTELCNGAVTRDKLAAAVQAMLMNADEKQLLQYYDRVRSTYLQILNGRDIQYDRGDVMLGRTYTGSIDDLDNEAIYLEAATPDQAGVMSADDKEALDGLVALIESDHDGVINKFNEIVEFLKGIQDTDTLAAIVNGIQTQITNVRNNALGPTVKTQFTANNGSLKFYTVAADTDGPADTTVSLPAATENATGLMTSQNYKDLDATVKARQQFNINGHFVTKGEGILRAQYNYGCTSFLPLNKSYPIIAKVQVDDSAAVIAYYDIQFNFISAVPRSASGLNVYQIDQHPSNATYFRVCSQLPAYIAGVEEKEVYYTHGPENMQAPNFELFAGLLVGSLETIKEQLFIDLWVAVVKSAGGYDPKHSVETGKNYKLNDLWFTYSEALHIYGVFLRMSCYIGVSADSWSCAYAFNRIETNIPIVTRVVGTGLSLAWGYGVLQIDKFRINYNENWRTTIKNLSYVVDCIYFTTPIQISEAYVNTNGLQELPRLVDIDIELTVNKNLSFAKSANLSLGSLQKLVLQAKNITSAIITVHADVYAKLIDEANTEWHKVLTDAEAKSIQFVSA